MWLVNVMWFRIRRIDGEALRVALQRVSCSIVVRGILLLFL